MTEEHPDEQVAADSIDPNANGVVPWQWPEWLTCVAISRDGDGEWYGWDGVPINVDDRGVWTASVEVSEVSLLTGFVDTSGFPDVPWNESLRVNPNYKAS